VTVERRHKISALGGLIRKAIHLTLLLPDNEEYRMT
tara:strand:+ start:5041 stop:5148 length:108 start_codon:yes stop_codon:yes gene_type:complete